MPVGDYNYLVEQAGLTPEQIAASTEELTDTVERVREELKELRQIVKKRDDVDFPGRTDIPVPRKVKEVR